MEKQDLTNNREIDLSTLMKVLRKYWILLLVTALLFLALGAVYTRFAQSDKYVGKASFWVNGVTSSNVSQSATMGAAQMATNYVELAGQDLLFRRAAQKFSLSEKWNCTEDVAVRMLGNMVTAGKSNSESFVFTVRVTSTSSKVAYEAINAIQHTMTEVVAEVNGTPESTGQSDYITLVNQVNTEADIEKIPRSYLRNSLVFALPALIAAYAVCLFLYMKNSDEKVGKEETAKTTAEGESPRDSDL